MRRCGDATKPKEPKEIQPKEENDDEEEEKEEEEQGSQPVAASQSSHPFEVNVVVSEKQA